MVHRVQCQPEKSSFYFPNNFVKNRPIFIIIGVYSSKHVYNHVVVLFLTSPEYWIASLHYLVKLKSCFR